MAYSSKAIDETKRVGISGLVAAKALGGTSIVRVPRELSGSIIAEMEPGERGLVSHYAIRVDRDGFMWVDMDDVVLDEDEIREGYDIRIQRKPHGFALRVPDDHRFYREHALRLPVTLPVIELEIVPA